MGLQSQTQPEQLTHTHTHILLLTIALCLDSISPSGEAYQLDFSPGRSEEEVDRCCFRISHGCHL